MLPRYELDTLPDSAWPRLYAVSQFGRQEISRSLWGHAIIHAGDYARRQGFTVSTDKGNGLVFFTRPIPYPSVARRVDVALAQAITGSASKAVRG